MESARKAVSPQSEPRLPPHAPRAASGLAGGAPGGAEAVPVATVAAQWPASSWLQTWVPITTSVVALLLSAVTWLQVQGTPNIQMGLPSIVRVSQGGALLYVQPSFIVLDKADPTAVVTSVRLDIVGPGGERPPFHWDESGEWSYNSGDQELTYERTADPVPIVITQERPELPTLLFMAKGTEFRAGRWDAVLTASGPGGVDLVGHFCLQFSAADVLALRREAGAGRFLSMRDDLPGLNAGDCHRFP